MEKVNLLASALVCMGAVFFTGQAAAQGAYVKLGVGQGELEDSDSETSFTLRGGYTFSENWSVEAAYTNYGESSESYTDPDFGSFSFSFEPTSFSVSVLGSLPVNDNFSLYAKGGFSMWELDVSSSYQNVPGIGSGSVSFDSDGTDLLLGLGAAASFNDTIGMFIEYETLGIDLDGTDLDLTNLTIGLSISF